MTVFLRQPDVLVNRSTGIVLAPLIFAHRKSLTIRNEKLAKGASVFLTMNSARAIHAVMIQFS